MAVEHIENDDQEELEEWLESFEWILKNKGVRRAKEILDHLQRHAIGSGVSLPISTVTRYLNTIPASRQPPYPGNREIEKRIKSIIRWNAMAMVVRANRMEEGIGGHISTYASAATLYEVAFNHFFKGRDSEDGPDSVFFQGHAAPGIYARAFLEGRLTEEQLTNFRRELAVGGGLSSYPHPWLMPNFWEFPTVSMGLGPLLAIYHARFNRYLEHRGILHKSGKVWAFLGDGECDEPEALGSISLAGREHLDNLIFVINANLQRLDGPVRGNGKIIQELEGDFRGAGWNVIKVVWGSAWDPLLERDRDGYLLRCMEEAVDGEFQKYSVESGSYIREHFFGRYPQSLKMVENLSDEELQKLNRGGHDPEKVYAAYRSAIEHRGEPTVIIAKTIKGYGLGESGEGKNITHQQKKLNEAELRAFRSRFGIPISDDEVGEAPFYKPADDSPELIYLHQRRSELGGYLPGRMVRPQNPLPEFEKNPFEEFYKGSEGRSLSTTMALVRLLSHILKDVRVGKHIVPIIPDEGRTFGMESLFRQVGIYSSAGQKYEPVDSDALLYYRELTNGQILEEGINEAGSVASFIAAGTSYITHGIPMIPFFLFYSMFGFQRVGDLIWAAGDIRARGFIIGGTAGRTTLNGEGLQHQDGQSPLLAYPHPHVEVYDPFCAYEVAIIVEEGIRRMYRNDESLIVYITAYNEAIEMPALENSTIREDVMRGIYKLQSAKPEKPLARARILASGPLVVHGRKALDILHKEYAVESELWSVTGYKQLYNDALETDRWNMLHPEKDPQVAHISRVMGDSDDVVVAVSDYVKAVPLSLANWIKAPFLALGTDGFGRSDTRETLRDFFELDERYIVLAVLSLLFRQGKIDRGIIQTALDRMGIDPEKTNPLLC